MWEIMKAALIVVFCAAVPIKMAAAQSISAERGYQTAMKPADIKKKIIKSKNTTPAKLVQPIYLGAAPYLAHRADLGTHQDAF